MSNRALVQDLERLMAAIRPMIEGVITGLKEDPTLAPEFRCPKDGSSRTFKISALLAARPRGTASSGGTTISFSGGSSAVDSLDPGPEPQRQGVFLKIGTVVAFAGAAFGIFGPAPLGCGGAVLFALGCVAAVGAWYADGTFEERHDRWKKKREIAQTHWWCEACHEVFLPESRPDSTLNPAVPYDEAEELLGDDTFNVERLRRRT